jgi:hypothetical protein
VARHDTALFEGTLADNLLTDGSSDEAALTRPGRVVAAERPLAMRSMTQFADATVVSTATEN